MSLSQPFTATPRDADAITSTARLGSVWAVLDHFGALQFSGEDASAFLQGQLTCDVQDLDGSSSTYGAYCSAKGRMLATFLLWREADASFLMLLSRDILPAVQKRLSMFVLRSRVRISDVSGERELMGAAGSGAAAAIRGALSEAPEEPHEVRRHETTTIVRLPDGRFILACPRPQAPALERQIAESLSPAAPSAWRWLDIRNGVPRVTAATQDQLVPQMANLELLGGVSFAKGCYTGQEIVARTQHLGRIKRRMFLANVSSPASAGDELYSDDLGNQASGVIVNAESSPDGGSDVLAVVQIASRESSTVHLRSIDGPALRFLPLPYSVT